VQDLLVYIDRTEEIELPHEEDALESGVEGLKPRHEVLGLAADIGAARAELALADRSIIVGVEEVSKTALEM
jgi:hypothetical protein